jgi:signal transduction histidine kinase
LRIEVADDGRGFDPASVSGSGLRGLQDRIDALGGSLRVMSQPHSGAALLACLPIGEARNG